MECSLLFSFMYHVFIQKCLKVTIDIFINCVNDKILEHDW